jgi:Major Facilitator Superfamily
MFFFLPESFWDRTNSPKENPDAVAVETQIIVEEHLDHPSYGDKLQPPNFGIETPSNGPVTTNSFIMDESKTFVQNIELGNEQSKSNLNLEAGISRMDHVSETIGYKNAYTERLRSSPERSFVQTLRPYNGRIRNEKWLKVACRPFILFAYPAVLWSALVYSLSVGWLIVLSESIDKIFKDQPYGFTSLQAGLIYISPFIGAVFGTAVAGKMSDIICRYMAKKNDGIFEPEFRLVMVPIIALCTTIGLMAFGWSAEIHDRWIIPTFFFGVISFGCSLGSTTAITFCVDSYKEYSGEALVTLNFSKSESRSSFVDQLH